MNQENCSNESNETKEVKETIVKEDYPVEDFLDEDKPLRHAVKKQNWCVISMLTPNCFPENKREQYKDQKILGLKFRGVYEEYEQASARAEQLQKIDKFHNVFVGEIGKWLPFDVDVSNMGSEDQVYREKSLNKYMKSYKEALHDEETTEKQRKSELLQGANVVTGKHSATVNSDVESNVSNIPKPQDTTTTTRTTNTSNNKIKIVEDATTQENFVNSTDTSNTNTNTSISKLGSYTVDKELEENTAEKKKLQKELESTKSSLAGLEDKLSAINDLYAKLKSS